MAETRAVLDGLTLCDLLGHTNIILQVDSKLALDWFTNSIQIPWTLRVWWRHVHLLASKLNITAIHNYREANSLADYLSKMGMQTKCMGAINYNVDATFRRFYAGEIAGIPYIRIVD
ncbi:Ribonuclease h domain [Thalictrum thalictroides]|uniref:Ribonuclease h domain n=1 Tax=Thalictrum thalictroides TaxID=46969 RepID=A0A7J6X5S4_THATH|nr:Ribonuclease h domain [Thalictrum thalictroides]